LRQRYGFDRPLYVQLGVYLRQLAAGDLGMSIYTGRPVLDDILERFPATIELTLVSIGAATLTSELWGYHGCSFCSNTCYVTR
jgi:peptide/nickel transport system permease protein